MSHNVDHGIMFDGVKSFGEIQLGKNNRSLGGLALVNVLKCPSKTILYSPAFEKAILVSMHDFEDDFFESISQKNCDNFEATIEKRDRSIVIDRLWRAEFGDKRDETIINTLQIKFPIVELIAQVIKDSLDDWPASF